jgi:hypothetical protein
MTDTTVTDRVRRPEWRPAEQSPQASAPLRDPFGTVNLFFSLGFSATC